MDSFVRVFAVLYVANFWIFFAYKVGLKAYDNWVVELAAALDVKFIDVTYSNIIEGMNRMCRIVNSTACVTKIADFYRAKVAFNKDDVVLLRFEQELLSFL
ncbi:hypothetical protein [Amphritea sp.]|uniref:hypothetical protein n=1 Tax=Amphritea sp. TaxID=1872502 RepID=UPI003A8E0B76